VSRADGSIFIFKNMSEEKKEETSEKTEATEEVVETKSTEEAVEKESFEETKKMNYATDLKPGMTIRVYQKIKEMNIKGDEKERVQYFEGIIIAKKHGSEVGGTITVRKISNGVGVEKIFPLNLPTIDKIEVKKQAKVRRAKLFFLRRGYKKRFKETKLD